MALCRFFQKRHDEAENMASAVMAERRSDMAYGLSLMRCGPKWFGAGFVVFANAANRKV